MQSFLVAVAFLTVLPVRFRHLPAAEVVARSRWWYPAVGLLLGALVGGWTELLLWLDAPRLGAFLVLLAWVGLTGALHIDGFCDLCDGLFGGGSAEDRLRIMKDPHAGTFALVGGVLLLLGKFVLLSEVMSRSPTRAPFLVGAAVVVARCLVICTAAGARYPRPEGTGKALIAACRLWEVIPFALLGVAASVLGSGLNQPLRAASLYLSALLAVLALRWLCSRRLGGITGDCLGAAIELAETVCLLAVAVFHLATDR